MPRPAASAIGKFANAPMAMLAMPATSAVAAAAATMKAVTSAPGGNAALRIPGFTATM